MKVEILKDADEVARKGAEFAFFCANENIAAHDKFVFAVSGGRTPWKMLSLFAQSSLAWDKVHIFQVDERDAPRGDKDRNLTYLHECFSSPECQSVNIHPIPLDDGLSFEQIQSAYISSLSLVASSPPILDLIHLGLGSDGHTASLVPNDQVLDVASTDVSFTKPYQGRARVTLTYPIINRSRKILWLVTGADKCEMFQRLLVGDTSIPAGKVSQTQACAFVDREVGGNVSLY